VADVAVRLTQVTKRFGGDAQGRRVARYVDGAAAGDAFLAVDHIDLTVHDGEFFSLLGPSGCG
jgi:ABC-type sugar transport system ATPase subunit